MKAIEDLSYVARDLLVEQLGPDIYFQGWEVRNHVGSQVWNWVAIPVKNQILRELGYPW